MTRLEKLLLVLFIDACFGMLGGALGVTLSSTPRWMWALLVIISAFIFIALPPKES